MDFHDSETQRLLRTTARSYFAEVFPFQRLSALHKGQEQLASSDVLPLRELGWLSLLGTGSDGHTRGSLLDAAVLVEEAGYACAPVPLSVANIASSLLSSRSTRTRAAEDSLITLDELDRSQAGQSSLTVTRGALSGRLRSVPFAHLSTSVIALTVIDGEHSLIALPLGQATIDRLILLDRACYADVTFKGVQVDAIDILASGDSAIALRTTCDALLTAFTTVEMAGLMRRILEMTAEHIKTREQFGQPIGKFQAARHRAAELLTQLETTRWAAYHALWRYEQDRDAPEIWLAKHWAARAADRVFQIAHLLHGGVGVGIEHPLHLYTQSIAAFAVRSGTMDEMTDRALESLDIAV
jgi:alkylation response protein AidB-like acyl-CoA dehydrogenase